MVDIEENQEAEQSTSGYPNYIRLAASIYDKANSLISSFYDQNVHFTSQDDEWEAHWRERTEALLHRFKDRWEALREIPLGGTGEPAESTTASNRQLASNHYDLGKRAADYFAAKPGKESLASKTELHGALNHHKLGNLRLENDGNKISDE